MKRTIGLAAAAILLGALLAACSQKPAESTLAPAATEAPTATEAPAPTPDSSPEPTPTAEPVEQEVADPADTAEEARPVYETDENLDAIISAHDEEFIQECMTDFGLTREEAEAALQQAKDQAEAAKAEMERKRQEYLEQWEAESQRETEENMAKKEQWAQETYGVSYEYWSSLTAEERYQLNYETRTAAKANQPTTGEDSGQAVEPD